MNYKKAFYSKLEDCYLGVKIKDFHKGNTAKSGFSNLLKIKEQYFAHIKTYLESQIESELLSHDIYNKLFTFFDSYLNESGTPFFTDTPIYKNIYAKVYTSSKDTSLFYKTQNLYYVKSDILYQSLTLSDEQENYEVVFDAREYQQNADNTKNKVLFKLDSISCNELTNTDEEPHNQILVKVMNQKDLFPELNNVFKQNSSEFSEDFLKSLKQKKLKFNEESLKKIFRSYKKQSEIDFFIHKNAKAFLQEQFDLWMFHYLYQESTIQEWNPEIIAHLQKIKNIAYEIIKLIADFENELKNIWLKPKFAKKTEYVFSIDTILQYTKNANVLLESIANDKGFEVQIKEWQELKLIDDFSPKGEDTIISPSLTEKDTTHSLMKEDTFHSLSPVNGDIPCSPSLAEGVRGWVQAITESDKYHYLPIDTKHFTKETKYQILSSFENLESLLNGELIKSDNFQALNTLMPRYQGKVDLIYIDPPYNAPASEIIYKNNFKDSTWLSMMENRLRMGKEFLSKRGILA
ncbi:MAG: site-specific DNA-methyltransferase, partial [Helicobacter sp.]|nr:site-specific DNA-methyltransferase [Helicobacter sp.]